ncbi:MAG: TraR/DksA family transcriptional regulator [Gammaproteobacteria bacterium]|nr:TraR/DksA family transcriptional regulator [Gammaproteobacteria bacterium]MDD9894963.1 TraR/DksA family transcriptional regulator [Gammaproteobacteria bacterium]MDD9960305.1 TraR/DksA family transcriptional regulator [Gammaproteobacteria bacterium]
MEELNPDELDLLHQSLVKLERELKEQLSINKESVDVVKLDQTLVGRVSRMDAMQQQSMAVSMRKKAQLKLRKVQLALASVASGDYGYCRRCDEAIGFPRLNAQPETNLCLNCQDKADQQA